MVRSRKEEVLMRREMTAIALVFTVLTAAEADEPPRNSVVIRCLNKGAVVRYDRSGKLNIELELAVTLDRELKLKPRDFRLYLLDAQLRQLDDVAVALPEEWEKKTFKKGETRETLTVQFPAPGG